MGPRIGTRQRSSVDIMSAARSNEAFRREVLTGDHEQVVVMTIPPGGEIGEEVHPDTDQVLAFVDGRGIAVLDGQRIEVAQNDLVFVRAGTRHNFLSIGDAPLRLITIYAPPEHPPGTVHQTKAEADAAEGHMAGTDQLAPAEAIDPDIVAAAGGARVVGAPTTDGDDFWAWPRRPAMALAKAIGARLVLADVSTRSAWMTPYGSGGFGAERRAPYSDGTTVVDKRELALLGHQALIRQVEEAEAAGIDAAAWLADRPGVAALDRFLELFPVDVLVVPPLDDPSFGDRLRGDDIAAVRRRMKGRLLLVAKGDGSLSIDAR